MKLITIEDCEKDLDDSASGDYQVYHIDVEKEKEDPYWTTKITMGATCWLSKKEMIEVDLDDYNLVANISLKEGWDSPSIWRLTNNVNETWSEEFDGDYNSFRLETMNSREDDLGHRSSMCGDIFYDVNNSEYWLIVGVGFQRMEIIGGEEE